jgi:cell division protease FtsH
MAVALLQYVTIDARQIDDIMGGRVPGPPADWSKDTSTGATPPPPKGDAGSTVGKVGDPAPQSRTGMEG